MHYWTIPRPSTLALYQQVVKFVQHYDIPIADSLRKGGQNIADILLEKNGAITREAIDIQTLSHWKVKTL